MSKRASLLRHYKMPMPLMLSALVFISSCTSASIHRSSSARIKSSRHSVEVTPAETTSSSAAGCPSQMAPVQRMNGSVKGCIRVGSVSPGIYSVYLDQVVSEPVKDPPSPPSDPSELVHLTLSPSSGKPGTDLTVTGTLATVLSKQPGHADLCFDGCRSGLEYSGVSLHWLSSVVFQAHLVVPAAPWIERYPPRVVPLADGTYTIGVSCLVIFPGCGLGGSEAQTDFKMIGVSKHTCSSTDTCAHLVVHPNEAFPGDVVSVSGFAPLVSVIGSDHPFVFQFGSRTGKPRGSEIRFTPLFKRFIPLFKGKPATSMRSKNTEKRYARASVWRVHLGHAALSVMAPPSFASLGSLKPVFMESDGLSPISANPAAPDEVAWCNYGDVRMSGPSGNFTIPTLGVQAVLKSNGLSLAPSSATPICNAVALPPPLGSFHDSVPHSLTGSPGIDQSLTTGKVVFASFLVIPHNGAPPYANVALYTTDGGQKWTLVPTPPSASETTFGGFLYYGMAVQVLYSPSSSTSYAPFAYSSGLPPEAQPPPVVRKVLDGGKAGIVETVPAGVRVPLVEETSNGGRSWSQGNLTCPPTGPCLEFGDYLWGNCAGNGTAQLLLRSTNAGKTWSIPTWPLDVQACAPAQIVSVTKQKVLLVETASPYPLLYSSDGGKIFEDIGIPSLSRESSGNVTANPGLSLQGEGDFGNGPGGLLALPNGALLYSGYLGDNAPSLELLHPHGKRFCRVRIPSSIDLAQLTSSHLYLIDSYIYWRIKPKAYGIGPLQLGRLSWVNLHCSLVGHPSSRG